MGGCLWMIYYNNVSSNISLHCLIQSKFGDASVLKGNILFTEVDVYELDKTIAYIRRYDEYLFYVLSGQTRVSFARQTHECKNSTDMVR